MLRLVAVLLYLVLESAVKLAVEPLVRLWLAIRPLRKLRQWRTRKRMASWAAEHPDEVREEFNSDEEVTVNEQLASVIRTVIKSAGGGLVGAGVVTSSELEVLAGAVAVLIGLAWSWWAKRQAA